MELYGLSIKFYGTNLEVDTNGADVALRVRVVGEPQEQTRLKGMRCRMVGGHGVLTLPTPESPMRRSLKR